MANDRSGSSAEKDEIREHRKSKAKAREDGDSGSDSESRERSKCKRKERLENSEADSELVEDDRRRSRSGKGKRETGKKRQSRSYDESDSGSSSDSEESESGSGSEDSQSESEEERRRRKKRERRKRREREEEKDRRRRRKEKEKKRRRKEKEEKRRKEKKRKEKKERGSKGAVTNSWGKYGILRETDMWNKRPEFTAWLAEVKEVNLESLPNWEEKQMFKQFMEDHNTATFPSKKYYGLDAYYKHKLEKEMKKGFKKVQQTERTTFNDEELRRMELLREREKQKEEQVQVLKQSMETGMAQAMKEQARLKEEMQYHFKLGNFEAAAAIQRRLDPDAPM